MSLPRKRSQSYHGDLGGLKINRGKSMRSDDVHPYLKRTFWLNPSNQFWETDLYSEKSKQYFRDCLQVTY